MKKMLAVFVLCIVIASAATPAAFAQTTNSTPQAGGARAAYAMQQLQSRFEAANVTHDGRLTRDQAQAGMPRVAQHFDEIDTQKAGYVTLPQIAQFMMQRAQSR